MNKEAISLMPLIQKAMTKIKPSPAIGQIAKGWAERAATGSIGLAGKTVDKTVDFLKANPKAENLLRNVTSYRFMDPANKMKNVLGGAAISSAVSGTGTACCNIPSLFDSTREVADPSWWNSNKTKTEDISLGERFGHLAKNTAIGAAAGAAPGALVGRYGPRVAQKGLGRVLTNTVLPYFYSGKVQTEGIDRTAQGIMRAANEVPTNVVPVPSGLAKIKAMASAIYHDKPMPHIMEEIRPGADSNRHQLFRDFFDLPNIHARDINMRQTGVDEAGGKIYQFDPHNPTARKDMKNLADLRASRFDSTNPNLLREHGGSGIAKKDRHQLLWDPTMANVGVDPKGNYNDYWDFATNSGEKIDSKEMLGRSLTSMFGTPASLRGKTLTQEAALRRTKIPLSKIHPSFLPATASGKSIAERVADGTGAKKNEIEEYINSLKPEQQYNIRAQLANRMQGKDVNYLEAMAKTEGVDTATMRQLLGGAPSKARVAQDARAAKATEGVRLSPENVQGIIGKRVKRPEDLEAVKQIISEMNPQQRADLNKSMEKWIQRGKSPEGFASVMQDRLGLGKEDLA